MRFAWLLLYLLVISVPIASATVDVKDGVMTANMSAEPLRQVVQRIESQTGIHFAVDDQVASQPISASFQNLPVAMGIKKMLEGTGINYAVIDGGDGKPVSVFIGQSEKPGESSGGAPRKADMRPAVNNPPPPRGVVNPVAPQPQPVVPQPQPIVQPGQSGTSQPFMPTGTQMQPVTGGGQGGAPTMRRDPMPGVKSMPGMPSVRPLDPTAGNPNVKPASPVPTAGDFQPNYPGSQPGSPQVQDKKPDMQPQQPGKPGDEGDDDEDE